MSYVLSLLLIIPFVGFLATWALGTTQKVATWVALAFSLAQLVLLTTVLLAFWDPTRSLAESILGPAASAGPAGWGGSPFYYYESAPWVPQIGMNYILGFDGLSVPLA